MKKKVAFTLAEVMITIAVLGVLAAILIPAITQTAPDTNKLMFKKAYSITENTIQSILNNDNICPTATMGTVDGKTNISLGLSSMSSLPTTAPAGSLPICYYFAQEVNILGNISCTAAATTAGSPSFITADGINWYITKPTVTATYADDTGSGSYAKIVVDVNGNKNPNCGAKIQSTYATDACGNKSQDRFMMGIRFDGKVKVFDTAGQTILENPTQNTK